MRTFLPPARLHLLIGMKTGFSVQFGMLLKSLRKERKISQQKLAESAGSERSYIYYLERGDSTPTIGVLIGLAHGLGRPFRELAALIEALSETLTDIQKKDLPEKTG